MSMQQLDRIGRARRKGRIRIDAPVVIAEDRVRGRAVIAARRKQIVEEEPVAIGVIQGVDLDFVWFTDAPESAPIVDQVAGHQQDVGAFLHFLVGGLEAPVEVVVTVQTIGQNVHG